MIGVATSAATISAFWCSDAPVRRFFAKLQRAWSYSLPSQKIIQKWSVGRGDRRSHVGSSDICILVWRRVPVAILCRDTARSGATFRATVFTFWRSVLPARCFFTEICCAFRASIRPASAIGRGLACVRILRPYSLTSEKAQSHI